MNGKNKDDLKQSFAQTNTNIKDNISINNKPSLKWSYPEYIKQQYAKELQKAIKPKSSHDPDKHAELFKCKDKWKFIDILSIDAANVPENQSDYIPVDLELKSQKPQKSNIFMKFIGQKQEIFKQKSELFKLQPKKEVEAREVDGFILMPDSQQKNKSSFQSKLRNYFLQNPDFDKAKQIDEADTMIEDFVLVDPKVTKDFKIEHGFKQALTDLTAGSLAGIVQVYVSQPFDTVKVKQQTFPKLYKNMFKCFFQTYRKDGVYRGLYAGSVPAVIASVAENSVLFAAYGVCQEAIAKVMEIDNVSEMSALGHAFAGFFAAFFSTFTICPTELIKCKLQAVREMKQYVTKDSKVVPITAFKLTEHIFLTEGVAGFYRGLTSTFVREMPGFFFFFGGYEATREYFTEPGQLKEDIGPFKTMCAGAVGGITLWTTTFPADVIKTRIQINNLKSTMLQVGSEILRKEGFLAFYNGLLSSVLRTIPATASLFLVYEYTKKILNNKL